MAELAFEAPLAQVENEEWNEFSDYSSTKVGHDIDVDGKDESEDLAYGENFSDKISKSLEDLVNTFDEKITSCFKNYEENVEKIAPVQVQSQEELLKSSQTWWTLTGNFGTIMPIDWTKSIARQLQEKALNLSEKKESDSSDLDVSDDEELRQAFDYHSMASEPDLPTELQEDDMPPLSADQVISEIEDMMSDEPRAASLDGEHLSPRVTPTTMESTTDLTVLHDFKFGHQTKEGLSGQSIHDLNEVLNDMEVTIRNYSEVLVADLALRDELAYEKELKNSFISLLLDVQKKRRDTATTDKKHNRRSMPAASGRDPNPYLTTLIPYTPQKGAPTVEQLQIYIKILSAIRDNDPNVPALLTDYILRVLCPTI